MYLTALVLSIILPLRSEPLHPLVPTAVSAVPWVTVANLALWMPGWDTSCIALQRFAPMSAPTGHLVAGNWEKSLMWGGAELGFTTVSYVCDAHSPLEGARILYHPLGRLGRMYANQTAMLTGYDVYRDTRLLRGNSRFDFVPVTTAQALASPFEFHRLKDPWVWVHLTSYAAVLTVLYSLSSEQTIFQTEEVTVFGETFSPLPGALLLTLDNLIMQYPTGPGEEAFFRGTVQPAFAEMTGSQTIGLLASTLWFASAHLHRDMDPGEWLGVGLISVNGLIFGLSSMSADYDFRRAAFTHTWANIISATLSLILAPPVPEYTAQEIPSSNIHTPQISFMLASVRF